MKKIRIFLVVATVLAMSGAGLGLPAETLAAPPTLNSAYFVDANHDGAIDRVKVVFDDVVTKCNYESIDWLLSDGSLPLTGPSGRLNNAGQEFIGCDGSTNYFYLIVHGSSGVTGYPSGMYIPADLQYRNLMTTGSVEGTGGVDMATSSIVNLDDAASPVVMSSSPAAWTTGVSVSTSTLSITFSEPMAQSTMVINLSGSGWGMGMWSSDGKTVTYSRTANFSYGTTYTVSVSGEDKSGYLLSSGLSPAQAYAWSFTTESAPDTAVSASQSTVSASPSSVVANNIDYSTITITARNASGSPLVGKNVSLSSSRGSTDIISFVNTVTNASGQAVFRAESGAAGTSTMTAVADGVAITQTANVTFTAVAPTLGPVSTSRSSVYASPSSVVANDSDYSNVTVTVRDASDNLLSGKTVVLLSSRTSDTVASLPGGSTTNSAGQATFQVRSNTVGTSTLTAMVDSITIAQTATVVFTAVAPPSGGLVYGDLFKESGSTAVYYYGTDGKRHVFPTQAIYFSWYSGFSGIKTVSRSTVTSVPLGGNVIVRPGTYLVQFVSMDTPFRVLDPKIYALTATGQLRWVTSASAATALYGTGWEGKIVAVPEVFRTNYLEGGADINSSSDYNKASVEAAATTISGTIR